MFLVTKNPNLFILEGADKTMQDFLSFSTLTNKIQVCIGHRFSQRQKQLFPRADVRSMAVYDDSIHVEDDTHQHMQSDRLRDQCIDFPGSPKLLLLPLPCRAQDLLERRMLRLSPQLVHDPVWAGV